MRRPTELLLLSPEGRRRVELDDRGVGEFRPLTTDSITVRVIATDSAVSLDEDGSASRLPVGIGEVRLRGVPFDPIRLSADARRSGRAAPVPRSVVDDVPRQTRLIASPVELYQGESVRHRSAASLRPGLSLAAGETAVRAVSSPVAVAERLVLQRSPSGRAARTPDAPVDRTARSSRASHPTPGHRVLAAAREHATPAGSRPRADADLDSVVVDGWQQGWRTDGSDDTVDDDVRARQPLPVGAPGRVALFAAAPGDCCSSCRAGAGRVPLFRRSTGRAVLGLCRAARGRSSSAGCSPAGSASLSVRRGCSSDGGSAPGWGPAEPGWWPCCCWLPASRTSCARGRTRPGGRAPGPGRTTWSCWALSAAGAWAAPAAPVPQPHGGHLDQAVEQLGG